MELKLVVSGLGNIPKLSAHIRSALERGLATAAAYLEGEVKERTPVRTGVLRASITHKATGSLRYEIGTDVEYGEMVEEGTKPHVILPRNKKALAWPGGGGTAAGLGRGPQGTAKRGGSLIVRRRVNHPGTKGAHMFRRAAIESVNEVQNIIRRQIIRSVQ